jgi:hypothetical protein
VQDKDEVEDKARGRDECERIEVDHDACQRNGDDPCVERSVGDECVERRRCARRCSSDKDWRGRCPGGKKPLQYRYLRLIPPAPHRSSSTCSASLLIHLLRIAPLADIPGLQAIAIVMPAVANEWVGYPHVRMATFALYAGLIVGATFWGMSCDVIGWVRARSRFRSFFFSDLSLPCCSTGSRHSLSARLLVFVSVIYILLRCQVYSFSLRCRGEADTVPRNLDTESHWDLKPAHPALHIPSAVPPFPRCS